MTEKRVPRVTEQQMRFIDFLVTPSQLRKEAGMPASEAEWAEKEGLGHDTPRRWKKKFDFRQEWDRRLAELNVAPDRIQEVIDSLYEAAKDRNVKAAELYLSYVSRFQPTQRVVIEDTRAVSDLSDAELAQLLREEAETLATERADDDGLDTPTP